MLRTALLFAALTFGRSSTALGDGWNDFVPVIPRTVRGEQGEAARKSLPAELQLRPPSGHPVPPDQVRSLRIRVYVTETFKQQNLRWESWLRRLLARVSQRTERWPGVRFELAEIASWSTVDHSEQLGPLLDELVRKDGADDVDLVVGLVASIPIVPDALDQIGLARLFSRHFVLRGIDPQAEYLAFRTVFDALTPAERDRVLVRRRTHAEEVLFLHEWAHTLGLGHVHRSAAIMSPRCWRRPVGPNLVPMRASLISR